MMKIRHNVCVNLARVFLKTISGIPGLSIPEVLVALSLTEKLMKKGTVEMYHSAPVASNEEIEQVSETLFTALIFSTKKASN